MSQAKPPTPRIWQQPWLCLVGLLLWACGEPDPPLVSGSGDQVNANTPPGGYPADPSATITLAEALATVTPGPKPNPNSLPPEFNRAASRAAFEPSVYPWLSQHCSSCHANGGLGIRPLHADTDVARAHDDAVSYANLRQVGASRLIERLARDGHHCPGDCASAAKELEVALQAWADGLGPENLPAVAVDEYPGEVPEALVLTWIREDRATLAAEDSPYVRYASLHLLSNLGATPDEMNSARVGLSKALNSTARFAPEIVNPSAIDAYSLLYRFDVRDYWGYARVADSEPAGSSRRCLEPSPKVPAGTSSIQPHPECGLEIYQRIELGNARVSADDTIHAELDSPSNTLGFHTDYVEACQLVYTLSRPDVYNDIMQIPVSAAVLEAEVGVDTARTYQFMTVDDAITISERLLWRTPIADGYYWKSVDQFSTVDFVFYTRPIPLFTGSNLSQIVTTPVLSVDGGASTPNVYTGDTGAQAQASEVIFSLPNGLQGYAIFGAGNQRRTDAFRFVVIDPRRTSALPGVVAPEDGHFDFRSLRLLNGASCMGCHASGMNRAKDDMRPYIANSPSAAWTEYAARSEVEALYPGAEVMTAIIEADRAFFLGAQQKIADEMMVGTNDKHLYVEPVSYMFENAQRFYKYVNSVSN